MQNTVDFERIVLDFKNQAWHGEPELAQAVIDNFGDDESFVQSAPDVANYGIDGGYSGFIYYSDTVPFAVKNKKACS